jgi:hypothetical protein
LRRVFPVNKNNIPPVTHEPLSDESSGNAGTDDQDFASEGSLDRPALLWVGVRPWCVRASQIPLGCIVVIQLVRLIRHRRANEGQGFEFPGDMQLFAASLLESTFEH